MSDTKPAPLCSKHLNYPPGYSSTLSGPEICVVCNQTSTELWETRALLNWFREERRKALTEIKQLKSELKNHQPFDAYYLEWQVERGLTLEALKKVEEERDEARAELAERKWDNMDALAKTLNLKMHADLDEARAMCEKLAEALLRASGLIEDNFLRGAQAKITDVEWVTDALAAYDERKSK